jgi:hypothetical protein
MMGTQGEAITVRSRSVGVGGLWARVVVVVAVLAGPLVLAPSASAGEHHPTGVYSSFVDCPLGNPTVTICIVGDAVGGEVRVGDKTVPIDRTIKIQGGLRENSTTGELEFVGAEGSATLPGVALVVPGGLGGVIAPALLPRSLRESLTGALGGGSTVTATFELAEPPSAIKVSVDHLLNGEGAAAQLAAKVKLSNAFLGNRCYIGSEAHPVVLSLTDGTTDPPLPNKPLTGALGKVEILEGANVIALNGSSFVDNAWMAPEVSGCGGSLSPTIDPAVDAQLGLPAAAGRNTAVLDGGRLEAASAAAVAASE